MRADSITTSADTALLEIGLALKSLRHTFTTITPASHARVNERPENAWATDLRGVFGWSRPFRPDLLAPDLVTLMEAAHVLERDGDTWRSTVRFSSYDDELFVHSAFPTAASDAVFFGPDTYRMADATLAHLGTRQAPVHRAADVCCGTAAGAIAVAKRAPDAELFALDINPMALRYARVDAAMAGTPRVRPRNSNLLRGVEGTFDLIFANPPFMLDPAGRAYRDGGGSSGHALSLAILDAAAERLAPGGSLVLFSGTGIVDGHDPLRAAATERLASAELSWSYREVDPDVYGEELADGPYRHADRIAVVVLTASRPQ